MKTRISAALALLNDLHESGHIRGEGNVKFQAAKAELEQAAAMPEVVQTVETVDVVGVKNALVAIDDKLEAIELHVATMAGTAQPATA